MGGGDKFFTGGEEFKVWKIDSAGVRFECCLMGGDYDAADDIIATSTPAALCPGMSYVAVSISLLIASLPSPDPTTLDSGEINSAVRRIVSGYVTDPEPTALLLAKLYNEACIAGRGFDVVGGVITKCKNSVEYERFESKLTRMERECDEICKVGRLLTSFGVDVTRGRTFNDVFEELVKEGAWVTAVSFRAVTGFKGKYSQPIPQCSALRLRYLIEHVDTLGGDVRQLRQIVWRVLVEQGNDFTNVDRLLTAVKDAIADSQSLLRSDHKKARRVNSQDCAVEFGKEINRWKSMVREIQLATSEGVVFPGVEDYEDTANVCWRVLCSLPQPITSTTAVNRIIGSDKSEEERVVIHDEVVSRFGAKCVKEGKIDAAVNICYLLSDPAARFKLSVMVFRTTSQVRKRRAKRDEQAKIRCRERPCSHVCVQFTSAIKKLSEDAFTWCSTTLDSSTLSETLRLISINGVIKKYTNETAEDSTFRFSDPHCARRLVSHVAGFVDVDAVFEDVGMIGEAFRCLPLEAVLADHLQKVVAAEGDRANQIDSLTRDTYANYGVTTGDSVSLAVVSFCKVYLENQDIGPRVSAPIIIIASVVKELSPNAYKLYQYERLVTVTRRIQKLQRLGCFATVEQVEGGLISAVVSCHDDDATVRRKSEILLGGRCESQPCYYRYVCGQAALTLHDPDVNAHDVIRYLTAHKIFERGNEEHKFGAVLSLAKSAIKQATKHAAVENVATPASLSLSLKLVALAHKLMTRTLSGAPCSSVATTMKVSTIFERGSWSARTRCSLAVGDRFALPFVHTAPLPCSLMCVSSCTSSSTCASR